MDLRPSPLAVKPILVENHAHGAHGPPGGKDSVMRVAGIHATSQPRRASRASGCRRARRFRMVRLSSALAFGITTARVTFAAAPVSIGGQVSVAQGTDPAPASEKSARP